MKPLSAWDNLKHGYEFSQPTSYNDFHIGLDLICKTGTQLFAPFNGTVKQSIGTQGGKTITFRCKGYTMRFLHLDAMSVEGMATKGTKIGETGNTGLSNAPHTHCDISKGDTVQLNNRGNFVDPWEFNWNGDYDLFNKPTEGEYMTEDEYREVVGNVVNGFYLNYYNRQGSDADILSHVNAIAAYNPRKYGLSDWVNRQQDEAEFKANFGSNSAKLAQVKKQLEELVSTM